MFNYLANFSKAKFDSLTFDRTIFAGDVILGSEEVPKFNLTRTIFSSNSKIILSELVELDMQTEKIKKVLLLNELSYNLKRLIIDNLKENSFKEDKKAQFELEYVFAKSTKYQDSGDTFIINKWYHIWKWPKWIWNFIYNITMGLGYRPFRLVYWVLLIVIGYSIFFIVKFKDRINQYIKTDDEEKLQTAESKENYRGINKYSLGDIIVNCVYFSAMIFFTFRLKRNILLFFDSNEKKIIISVSLIGFLIYISFLSLSKAGSILHTLTSLFTG